MKILVICQYYYPEPFKITDICEALVKRGHSVTVVTGTPNYPMGEIYKGYENGAHQDEKINGVRIHRCKIHPRKSGIIHRLWNYYSFEHQSQMYVNSLDESFDVVFINQLSPVMMAKAGLNYAIKHHKKSVLYCLDLWPASLGAGGISGGIVYKWFHRVSKKIYRSSDRILVSSKSFADYFKKEFGINNTAYLPQYAEDAFSFETCQKKTNEYIDLMFAGNVGTAQSVNTIIKAAVICKNIPQLRWHIVGDGIELEHCKEFSKKTGAPVIFHGRKPLEDMPKYYAMADAMLVTMQKDDIISKTLPGKVQTYMAAGKAIIGAIDGEASTVIKEAKCGYCCGAEDFKALSKCVKEFIASNNKSKFSSNSFAYYQQNFSKEKFIDCLEAYLEAEV